MEQTEQESKQNEEQWDALTFDKTEENCKGKSLLNWRMETRAILNKVKSSLVDDMMPLVKIPEPMQKTLDAYLTVLGFRTVKARNQAMKEFKNRTLDLLKAAKTKKPSDLTYEDCTQIQEVLSGVDVGKAEKINLVLKDFIKWTTNMVQLRIAEQRYPEAVKEASTPQKPEKKAKVEKKDTKQMKDIKPKEEDKGTKLEKDNKPKEESKDSIKKIEDKPSLSLAQLARVILRMEIVEVVGFDEKNNDTKVVDKKVDDKRVDDKKVNDKKVNNKRDIDKSINDKAKEIPKKPSLPKLKKKKVEEEKEDWSIFRAQDDSDPQSLGEVISNITNSHGVITPKDITYLLSLRSPHKTVLDIINGALHLLGAKTDSEKDHKLRLYKAKGTLLKEIMQLNIRSVTFSDMKYLRNLFKLYPDMASVEKTSPPASHVWQWLHCVYEARPVYEYHCLKSRLTRNPAWESFTISKSEEEATGENFNLWMTATYDIINQIQQKDLTELKACKVLNDKIIQVLKAIGIISGSKTPKQIEQFAVSGIKKTTFLNDLSNLKIDQLTLEDCIEVFIILDELTKDSMTRVSIVAAQLYDFAINFTSLRIAVGLYGERTGYTIGLSPLSPEEEKVESSA